MPDWSAPETIAQEAVAFLKLMHVLAGIYFWEFVISLKFDWMFLTGKKKFQWPMIFYFLNRYCLFFALIGILIALDSTEKVACQPLYTFNQLIGNAAVGLASVNLALRTMAIWNMNVYVIVPLVIVILGHWTLILQGVLLKAEWVDGQGCVILQTNNTVLAATFIYSMCFDFIVLFLSATKLFNRRGASQIVKLLFKDGLVFFMIAFIANLIATTFMLLNLNPVMSVIFNVPAAVASTIVACRAVRRLNSYSSNGPEVYSGGRSGQNQIRSGGVAFASSAQSPSCGPAFGVSYPLSQTETTGIHVRMDTFTITDGRDEVTEERKSHDGDVSDVEMALENKSKAL
ncbi:hypothetical protein BXZ70DRAFT_772096 [Cristinia sonorae]|uniref:Transmembrane protein n=1 Tax=Cristinia sonorae TaxID=1940300 RepID=A0A8K0XRY0_9AGAR|nr:hypothetical protein BXZ70DRAFT_772096 [Cristinia sonorae]